MLHTNTVILIVVKIFKLIKLWMIKLKSNNGIYMSANAGKKRTKKRIKNIIIENGIL